VGAIKYFAACNVSSRMARNEDRWMNVND
jgi:hypothetical protein